MTCYDKISLAIKRLTTKQRTQRPGVVRRKELGGRMELGHTVLKDGTPGEIIQLYNLGCSGLFKATNGPVFTISERDITPDKPLRINTVLDVMKDLQALCNGTNSAV